MEKTINMAQEAPDKLGSVHLPHLSPTSRTYSMFQKFFPSMPVDKVPSAWHA